MRESPVSKQRRNGLLADQTVSALETLTCMSKKAGRPDCECRSDRMSAQHGAIRGLSWFVVSALADTEVCVIRPASGRQLGADICRATDSEQLCCELPVVSRIG